MAASSKLILSFADSNDDNVNFTYNHAKKEASSSNVKALMEGIVANGEIFEKTPASIKSAKIVTTETQEVDLS